MASVASVASVDVDQKHGDEIIQTGNHSWEDGGILTVLEVLTGERLEAPPSRYATGAFTATLWRRGSWGSGGPSWTLRFPVGSLSFCCVRAEPR